MKLKIFMIAASLLLGAVEGTVGQCETWNDNPNKEEIIGAHSVYRQNLKAEEYDAAYEYWKTAYENAPAADGKRDFHFMDGIKIYKHFYKQTEDEAKKKEYAAKIIGLYEQAVECYRNGAITIANCNDQKCLNERIGLVLGRQAYDMYYLLGSDQEKTYNVSKESVKLAGNKSEYIEAVPAINLLVNQYIAGKIDEEEARQFHKDIVEFVDYNIENNETYGQYYEQVKQNVEASIARIEGEIYDCDYFKGKLLPEYRANPEDGELIKKVYNKLLAQGCDKEDPIMIELEEKYVAYASKVNEELQKELEAKNPSIAGKRLYDEGKYDEAVLKYQEAIEKAEDDDKKAEYYFVKASIQGRKLNSYSTARSNALKAAKLRPNWGRPYMLIGDLYAITSRNCGDSWNQRLAVLAAIDKYAYAKSIDPEVAAEANEKIARYNSSKPIKDDAFMMGFSEGDVIQVECWIGEKVRLRF